MPKCCARIGIADFEPMTSTEFEAKYGRKHRSEIPFEEVKGYAVLVGRNLPLWMAKADFELWMIEVNI